MSKNKDTTWGVLSHFSAFLGIIIPFGNILGPLLVYLLKKEESDYIEQNAKNSLNFQITMTIYLIISAILTFVLIGFLLLLILAIVELVLIIIASIKASNGEIYSYPATYDFIS